MSLNKHALIRYRTIDACLSNRFRFWTESALLDALSEAITEYTGSYNGISRRTLFADLKAMKPDGITGYDAPIYYSKSRGYHYADPDYSINQLPLSNSDIVVLQQALHALQAIRGTGIATALDTIIHRLERRLAPVPFGEKVEAPIQFEPLPSYTGTKWLQSLYEAIQEQQPQALLYQPYHSEEPFEVVVHPYLLKAYQHRWFLVGHNPGKSGLRVFALDRIVDVGHAKQSFLAHSIEVSTYFEHAIGTTVPDGRTPETIQLRFSPGRGPYVRTKPIHQSQQILVDSAAGLDVSLFLIINPELMTKLLGYGADVEVLTPASLRVEIQRRLQKALRYYTS
jgi:predicted DNA-binding transcriptional regulator YafY